MKKKRREEEEEGGGGEHIMFSRVEAASGSILKKKMELIQSQGLVIMDHVVFHIQTVCVISSIHYGSEFYFGPQRLQKKRRAYVFCSVWHKNAS